MKGCRGDRSWLLFYTELWSEHLCKVVHWLKCALLCCWQVMMFVILGSQNQNCMCLYAENIWGSGSNNLGFLIVLTSVMKHCSCLSYTIFTVVFLSAVLRWLLGCRDWEPCVWWVSPAQPAAFSVWTRCSFLWVGLLLTLLSVMRENDHNFAHKTCGCYLVGIIQSVLLRTEEYVQISVESFA